MADHRDLAPIGLRSSGTIPRRLALARRAANPP
jgi:hypothetical protein